MSIMLPTIAPCSALLVRRGVLGGFEAGVAPLERRLEPLLGGDPLELTVLLGVRHHDHGKELAAEIDRRAEAAQVVDAVDRLLVELHRWERDLGKLERHPPGLG